ncbi:hypothetical protein PPL_09515 [Heterostelium album PN500]|uniref:Dimethylargininase n=1 Tax=Heterostelium pallidum (strain ATCC 26659 / Pp 5 / PN500) TaxID=670386 RepID=D3BNA4_HETP5|nr:hypothetical protein PPL_09515 [Heterostelium album PN500]EFA76764.1 hypothetical protein PPL_09515 [Heterostelium album PN500]|eukprot:XP_020428896.1 hypothetical protein PPL_09515 [Heterostelium album PN500]
MKVILSFVVLFLIASSTAIQVREQKPVSSGPSPAQFGDFVLGFVAGMEIAMNGNSTECVVESNATFDDFANGFTLIGEGFDHLSASDVEQGIELVGEGLAQIPQILSLCGVTEFIGDIVNVAKELSSGTGGIIEVILKEALNIFHNREDITEDWKNMVNDWKSGDYQSSGQNLGLVIMNFQHIITRLPSKSLVDGLTSSDLGKPDYKKAVEQHQKYIEALLSCGVDDVLILPPNIDYPDSVFVEDPVLCTPHCAIITRPGATTRREETKIIEPAIHRYYSNVERIQAPGTLEAGDVMMVGNHYYIGVSARTNEEGANQLIAILKKYKMTGSIVPLKKVLHLKTGLSYIENNNLLACGEFLTLEEFQKYNIIEVDESESYAANCIWVNSNVIMPAGFPKTAKKVADLGYNVITVDVSEFQKIDGGSKTMILTILQIS